MVSVKKLLLLVLCGYHCLPARADYKVLATGSQKAGVVCGEPLGTYVQSCTHD
jgi:hypothetical protein